MAVCRRKRVGGEVCASDSAAPAATVMTRTSHREGVTPATLVLPADNGGGDPAGDPAAPGGHALLQPALGQ